MNKRMILILILLCLAVSIVFLNNKLKFIFKKWDYSIYEIPGKKQTYNKYEKLKSILFANIYNYHIQNILKTEVNPRFIQKLNLPTNNFSVFSVNSTSKGRSMYFFRSDNHYQKFIDAGKIESSPIVATFHYLTNYQYSSNHDSVISPFDVSRGFEYSLFIHNGTFVNSFPHSDLNNEGTATFSDIKIQLEFPPDKYYPKADTIEIHYEGISVTTGDNLFTFWSRAYSSALSVIEGSLNTLYSKDSIYRQYKDEPLLAEIAKEIQRKSTKALANSSFQYSVNERREDLKKLHDQAKKLNFSIDYANEVLILPENQPTSGNLLWYYEDTTGFINQWLLIQIIFFAIYLSTTFISLNYFNLHIIFSGIFIAINGFIFFQRPNIELYKFIFPGILFLIFVIYIRYPELTSKKRSPEIPKDEKLSQN